MGNYYILSVDVEPKVIGVRDGCAQAEIQRSGFKDKKAYDRIVAFLGGYDSWTRVQDEPDFNFELQCVQMKKSAKQTDFMLFAPHLINCPFLVSEKAKILLDSFKASSHKFYNADVYTKDGSLLNYYLFFCRSLDYRVINFSKSLIFDGLIPGPASPVSTHKKLNISSASEYKKLAKDSIVSIKKYVLNDDFDKSLDLFVLGANVFISEKLRDKIFCSDLLGADIEPAFGNNLWWRPTLEIPD